MKEQKPKALTPEAIILNAFVFFKTATTGLSQDGLVRIALMQGCPSEALAVGVLRSMVARGLLTQEEHPEYGTVYKPVASDASKLH